MENKDKYELFKDIYLELLRFELSSLSKFNIPLEELDTEKAHKRVFSRAFMLTAFAVNDVKEAKIIS